MSLEPQNDFENDPVWDLLDSASEQQPSSLFSRNVMRAIRLEEKPTPLWKRLLAPRPAISGIAAAAACMTITFMMMDKEDRPLDQDATGTFTVSDANTSPASTSAIDQLASEYSVPTDLDEVIDPLMLISLLADPSEYSLDELGL